MKGIVDGLELTVLTFFWETSWFEGLLVAGLCGGALGCIYWLKTAVKRWHSAQEAFTRQLILAQENERKRVAAELHDGIGQDLLLVKNRLGLLTAAAPPEIARELREIATTTSRTIADVRSISHGLRPSALEQVGLTKAIEWMVEQVAETSNSSFSSELENIDRLLTPELEINVYRIVQEAMNNVIKHSQASKVIVEAKREQAGLFVSVFDNGQGFDAEHACHNGDRPSGFGLRGMEERARVIGGRLEIQSTPAIGTRLILHVPRAKNGK